MIAFFVIAVIWALVGEVDIVATAQGKIIPSGRVKLIQPMEIGVVRQIRVQEGQQVNESLMLSGYNSCGNTTIMAGGVRSGYRNPE